MSNFFMPCKRKAGAVLVDDDDYCHVILFSALGVFENYKLGGK